MVHSESNTGVEVTQKTGVLKHLRNTAEEPVSLTVCGREFQLPRTYLASTDLGPMSGSHRDGVHDHKVHYTTLSVS